MYKLRRTITANANTSELTELSTEARYSNADLLDLLLTIRELQGQPISVVENKDGSCDFTIGNLTYSLVADNG